RIKRLGVRLPSGALLIQLRQVAQLGRALGLGPSGRRFESCLLDSIKSQRVWRNWQTHWTYDLPPSGVVDRPPSRESIHHLSYVWGLSSAGRAPALHAGGQRFDPASLHHSLKFYVYHGGVAQLARAYGSYP